MEQKTIDLITENALLIEEYAELPDRLRAIARFVAEPKHKKELQAAAKLLEVQVPDSLFQSPLLRAYRIYLALLEKGLSDEEIATKMACSLSTAKGTILGLKKGGLSFQETASTVQLAPTGRKRKARRID